MRERLTPNLCWNDDWTHSASSAEIACSTCGTNGNGFQARIRVG